MSNRYEVTLQGGRTVTVSAWNCMHACRIVRTQEKEEPVAVGYPDRSPLVAGDRLKSLLAEAGP